MWRSSIVTKWMERSIVEILTNQDHTKVGLMSMNGGETMGLGMDVDITEIEDKLTPAALPFHPLVADGCNALMKVSNKLYNDSSFGFRL